MRRSALLTVAVFCPHFKHTVAAELNDMIGRLVHCNAGETCREQAHPTDKAAARPYPAGCPVYPSLAARA